MKTTRRAGGRDERTHRTRVQRATVFVWLLGAAGCDGAPERRPVSAAAAACGADTTASASDRIRELVIPDAEPPCELVFVPTGVVLSSDPNGDWPDPGSFHARDSRGRYYTNSTSQPGVVALWESNGSFARGIGRLGEGPGEFSRSVVQPWVIPGDTLVFYNSRRFTVFDGEGVLIGTIPSRLPIALRPRSYAVASGGLVLVGEAYRSSQGRSLSLVTMSGEHLRSYGDSSPGVDAGDDRGLRAVAMQENDRFWASLLPHEGYAIEHWTLDGDWLQSIRREASWAPRPLAAPAPAHASRYLPFKLSSLNVDDDGLLYALTLRMKEGVDPDVRALDDSAEAELFDVRLEVIDPIAGRVLARLGPISGPGVYTQIPWQFGGSRLGARRVRTADDLTSWEIVEFVMRPREQS